MRVIVPTILLFSTLPAAWLQVAEPRVLHTLSAHLEQAPSDSTKHCFSHYLPMLEDVGSQWSVGYTRCMQNASTVRSFLLTNVSAVQDVMRQSAMSVQSYINVCLNITDQFEFFNCFAKLSKQSLPIVYGISFNATEDALSLSQQLSNIEVNRYLCTNQTEQNYAIGTAQVFDELDKCLQVGPAKAGLDSH